MQRAAGARIATPIPALSSAELEQADEDAATIDHQTDTGDEADSCKISDASASHSSDAVRVPGDLTGIPSEESPRRVWHASLSTPESVVNRAVSLLRCDFRIHGTAPSLRSRSYAGNEFSLVFSECHATRVARFLR